jgi:hypothetical protein
MCVRAHTTQQRPSPASRIASMGWPCLPHRGAFVGREHGIVLVKIGALLQTRLLFLYFFKVLVAKFCLWFVY